MNPTDRPVPRGSHPATSLPRGSAARRTVLPDPFRYTMTNLEQETGVSARTIRYYITEGLLPAAEGRGPSATYTQSHLLRVQAITLLREQGMQLKSINERLEALSDEDIRTMLNVEAAPREDVWRRIALHPRLELQVREDPGGADYAVLRVVEMIKSVVRDELGAPTEDDVP